VACGGSHRCEDSDAEAFDTPGFDLRLSARKRAHERASRLGHFRTGWRVFSIKGYFNKGEFDDSVSRIVERASLGKGNYDRKVFNNIWGTFTFGPDNTVYLGAYRGFLRFWSDDEMPK
jgi:hypothetical protein